jgi:hypothetical protein
VLNLITNTVDLVRAVVEEILLHLSRDAEVADTRHLGVPGPRSA